MTSVASAPALGRSVALLTALLLPVADDLGPRDLPAKAGRAANDAQATRAGILADLKAHAGKPRESRATAVAALEALVATWVPGGAEPKPADRAALAEAEQAFVVKASGQLAKSAEALLKAELGGAAGFEAYRALGLDPANAKA